MFRTLVWRNAQKKGRTQMIERLRVRQAELKTLSALDLLPPAARILVRATVAYTPVAKAAFMWSVLSFVMVFLFGLIGRVIVSRVKKSVQQASARLAGAPVLPQEVPPAISLARAHCLPCQARTFIWSRQGSLQATPINCHLRKEATGEQMLSLIFVAEQLSDVTHARIILMAQDAGWGRKGYALASRLVRRNAPLPISSDA